MQKKTVVIADDHVLIAKAISSLIAVMPDYEVIHEAENGFELIEWLKLRKKDPDIILMDINMPRMNGYETAEWVKQNRPKIAIIALTMINDEKAIIKMIRSGASGYLLKDIHPLELEKALNLVLEKGYYYTDSVANKLVKSITTDDASQPEQVKLTEKEVLFLKYACTELTYKEIAAAMKLSTRTVEGYRDHLFMKLNIKSRVGLVLFAIRNNFFQLQEIKS
jgi:DNA-binding NarL/FixJ family response regulator